MKNAIDWFQIPASDFRRAVAFYSNILDVDLAVSEVMGAQVAILPFDRKEGGVGGAIYSGSGFEPMNNGTIVYLHGGNDLSIVLNRVEHAGGKIDMPKTATGNNSGFIARFIDSEGNRVGLHSGE